ncbi:MAG: histidine kinase [Bacilli bacterium]|nr:histidine kinase [Bacilli bacterium]
MKAKINPIIILVIDAFFFLLIFAVGIVSALPSISGNEASTYVANTITIFALFALLLLIIIESIAPLFIKQANRSNLVFMVGLFFTIFFSKDALNLFRSWGLPPYVVDGTFVDIYRNLQFASFMVVAFSFYIKVTKKYGVSLLKGENVTGVAVLIVCHLLFIGLTFADQEFVAFVLLFVALSYFSIRVFYLITKEKKQNLRFFIYTIIVSTLLAEELLTPLSAVSPTLSTRSVLPIGALIIFFAYFIAYLDLTISIQSKAHLQEEYERKVNELQANVLKNQIKPHFIFNALNVIKTLYMTDHEKGEEALDLLSKHLRMYVSAADVYLVPLDKELEIIENYLELENMKVSKPFNIIYNIDVYDFEVPYFSIQPLIENIVHYSKINEKEDGTIEIITYKEDDYYFLIVADNGVGFDVKQIKETSAGLKNCVERFKILLNASVEVTSKINSGTRIIIKIPIKKVGQK